MPNIVIPEKHTGDMLSADEVNIIVVGVNSCQPAEDGKGLYPNADADKLAALPNNTTLQGQINTAKTQAISSANTYTDTAVSAKQSISEKNLPNGYAGVGNDGKLPPSLLPPLAIVQFLGNVASQAAMLLLIGQQGDWCIRTDIGTVFIIVGDDPTDFSDWQELAYPAAGVISVDGHTGAVSLIPYYIQNLGSGSLAQNANINISGEISSLRVHTGPHGTYLEDYGLFLPNGPSVTWGDNNLYVATVVDSIRWPLYFSMDRHQYAGLNPNGQFAVDDTTVRDGAPQFDASAVLTLNSLTRGFLMPRLTTTQIAAISSPAEGLQVYDLTIHKLKVYTGSAWETITSV